ncbi:MAG: hypothetical protein RIR18_569, partial [Pseudomonadota bacterium]
MVSRQFSDFLHCPASTLRRFSRLFCVASFAVCLFAACSQPMPFPPIKPLSKLIVLTPLGSLSYEPAISPEKTASGFGHDLVSEFANTQGLEAEFVTVLAEDIPEKLRQHKGHLAVGWIHSDGDHGLIAGPTIAETVDVLVQHQSSVPVRNIHALMGQTLHIAKGSHADMALAIPKTDSPENTSPPFDLKLIKGEDAFQLLEKISNQEIEFAIVDKATFSIALNYFPNLVSSLKIGKPYPITWLFPAQSAPLLLEKANQFIQASHEDGSIRHLLDRYLGHVERLTQNDSTIFIERIQSALPQLRVHFISAQEQTGIDWRLLAAIAYRESGWDPLATSHTN